MLGMHEQLIQMLTKRELLAGIFTAVLMRPGADATYFVRDAEIVAEKATAQADALLAELGSTRL